MNEKSIGNPSSPGSAGRVWGLRIAGFFFTIVEVCALGGLVGAIFFPLVGRLAGVRQTLAELIVLGVRSGGFFFLVWAPGVALVRAFMRARAESRKSPSS